MAWRLALLLVAAATLYLGCAFGLDRYGRTTRPRAADAIVVLGCRVTDGGEASFALAARARLAAELWAAGVAPQVIVTGGIGDHPPSEAEAARRVLRARGVPDGAIVIEDASTSTEENLAFARARTSARRVVVVSDAYHLFRAERTARRYFDDVSSAGAGSPRAARLRGALREVIAVVGYAALGRLGRPARDPGPPADRREATCLPASRERLRIVRRP